MIDWDAITPEARQAAIAAGYKPMETATTEKPTRKPRPLIEPHPQGHRYGGRLWLTQRIRIPFWHPRRLNELVGVHHMVAARRKADDRERIALYADAYKLTPASGKRRVELTIVLGKGQRAGDPDAYFKSICDALVHAKLLIDDNRQNVELAPVQFEREQTAATVITLIDL